ncbi:sulfatase family protein [Algibacillus agarilyticus]|uniref:sulfatase family protein n=1 Tax=Algibacillus agarilyticus TaxID=2234133 RepID=UPI001E5BACAC|nr:sulfatase [Algibacillus agarilyticus]
MIQRKLNTFFKVFKTRKIITAAMCTSLLALTSACSTHSINTDKVESTTVNETPPNILLILSDDHAWSDYGFMGHDIVKTPALDKLANEGVTFKRAYVPTSLCRPSLATIATGLYASQHGITGNGPSKKVPGGKKGEKYKELRAQIINKVDKLDTLPELLRTKGYVSHQSGKWWEGSFKRGGFDQGMTKGFGNHPKGRGRHGDDGLKIGRTGLAPVTHFIDEAVSAEKPFLVWYAPFMPHSPHTPPERILKKYTDKGLAISVAKYYAMIEWFDETNGELFAHLEKKGVKDNTLIVYVSDNGWVTNPKKTDRFLPLSKQSPGESGVRTPIMFSLPSQFKAQMRPELVSSIDIVPTILGAAGLEVPAGLPGKNLFADMKNATPIDRNEVYGEGFAHDMADINDMESTLLYRWVIEGDWKLILSYDGKNESYQQHHKVDRQGPRLYKVSTDEYEQVNLAKQHPEIVARLSQKLVDWYPLQKRNILQK